MTMTGFAGRQPDPSMLIAPFAKIERSATQINDFGGEIRAFFDKRPYDLVSESNPEGIEEIWRFKLNRRLPHSFNVKVGEILHNLRSPLDQILSAIALQSQKTSGGVAFPFGRTKIDFEAAVLKQKKLPSDAIRMIEALQPYMAGGNALLAAIHYLNTPDKHRPGLIPVNIRTTASQTELIVRKGRVTSVGPRSGRHLILDANNNMIQEDHDKQPRMEIISTRGPVLVLEADDPNEDYLEIARSDPGTVFEADFEPDFVVVFRDIEGIAGNQPAVAILHQMRQLVGGILNSFKDRFF
jgi:hypothetical protein